MSKARIGFDATAAFTQGGGIGRYTRDLLGALLELGDNFHFNIFAAQGPQDMPVRIPAIKSERASFRQIPLSPRWLYRLWYRLRLPLPVQLFTGPIDLFHSPDFVLPPVFGRTPTLLTVHDLSFEYYPETFTPSLVSYLKRVVPWSVARASHVLADSESTARDLVRLYGTSPQKITVLYSGVDERFKPVKDGTALHKVRRKYGIGDSPYIFTVSTLQPRKNHQMLISAYAKVADKMPHDLVIAGGKGWLYEKMGIEVKDLGLAHRVRFIGFADDEDLPALYSDATCFVFPSLYEGFGLPVLEAMACGTPVVTSDASSLPEVGGNAALQLSPTDVEGWAGAMLSLAKNDDLRTRLMHAGFAQKERFSWHESARQLMGVYERLLN